MKLTQSELTAFLKNIGLASVELVEKEEESEYDNDALLKSVDDNRRGILKPLIEAEVKETFINNAKATAGGSLRSALARSTGIKRADLEKYEKDEEAINAALEFKMGLIDSEKTEVKKQLDDILEANKAEKEKVIGEYESKLKEATDRYTRRDIKDYVAAQLKEAPIPKKADRDVVIEDVVNHIMSKHDLRWDEATKAADLFVKGKDMPLMNEAKNQKITILDEAKPFLQPRGLWEEDMSGRNPAEEMQSQQTQNYNQTNTKTRSLNPNIQDKKADFMKSLKETVQNPTV